MAKKSTKPPTQQPVRTKSVLAGECPTNAAHRAVSVYRTVGVTRYCKCNDCGATWKIVGEAADTPGLVDEDRGYLLRLADGLQTAPRATVDNVEVIQVDAGEADDAARQLRRIAA